MYFYKLIIIVQLILWLGAVNVFAQCEYEYEEEDKFSGAKKVKTEQVKVSKGFKRDKKVKLKVKRAFFATKIKGSNKALELTLKINKGNLVMNAQNDDHLVVLLANDETIKLPMNKQAGTGDYKQKALGFEMSIEFLISDKNLAKLKKHKITDIRAKATMNGFDMEINEDAREEAKQLFHCIDK